MAKKVSNLYETLGQERLEMAGEMVKAMGHPMRIAILDLLRGKSKVSVTEIFESLDISQAVASQHLTLMKDRRVLKSQKNGKQTLYRLRDKEIEAILDLVVKIAETRPI